MKQTLRKKVSEAGTSETPLLNVIRSETVLSKLPLHNLSKKGGVKIEIGEKNDQGVITLQWKVFPNSAFGEPRQLAYKLDTIIINRRIEEAGRPVPKTVRLGSLREIAGEVGIGGGNTDKVKLALRQNASTFIIAKLKYKGADGVERSLEADFTRYSIVFTGEQLPDGRKADAVYLILNDIYQEVLNTATFRPLDYDYLKILSPASQRFYEILSYRIFGALHHKRPEATISYSSYCTYSAQERYFIWEQVKKQIYKLHRPHITSGYLAGVSHEATFDSNGQPDWILRYVPGPKARVEYKTFTTRSKSDQHTIDVEPDKLAPKALPKPESITPPLTDEQKQFIKELVERFSVHEDTATELVTTKLKQVALQVELYPHRQHSRIKDPAAYIIRAIERNYSPPTGYQEQKARNERKEEETKVKALEQARKGHLEAHHAAWLRYLGEREAKVKETHQEAYRAFGQRSIIERERVASSSKPKIREMQEKVYDRTDCHLNRFHKYFKDYPGCEVLDFWTWDSRINPTPFEG